MIVTGTFNHLELFAIPSGKFLLAGGRGSSTIDIVDLDAKPFVPKGWVTKEHLSGGQLKWDASKIALYLSEKQYGADTVPGTELFLELVGKRPFNANFLDYLLTNQHLIPVGWRSKRIFFWGTLYQHKDGYDCVRYLSRSDTRWVWRDSWLGLHLNGECAAAVRAG